jgi:uncharacterized lipoprotein YajG
MKSLLVLAALGAALLTGCTTVYRDVAYTPTAPVVAASPTYVAPGYTVVVPHY